MPKINASNFNPPESLSNMEIGPSLNISDSRKYKKAKANFDIPDGEDVYIIYDSTVFGSCKKDLHYAGQEYIIAILCRIRDKSLGVNSIMQISDAKTVMLNGYL